jgi:hypothetical protein
MGCAAGRQGWSVGTGARRRALAGLVGEDENLLRGCSDAMKVGVQASRDEARSDAATRIYENEHLRLQATGEEIGRPSTMSHPAKGLKGQIETGERRGRKGTGLAVNW